MIFDKQKSTVKVDFLLLNFSPLCKSSIPPTKGLGKPKRDATAVQCRGISYETKKDGKSHPFRFAN
jgi:hypothetical protein